MTFSTMGERPSILLLFLGASALSGCGGHTTGVAPAGTGGRSTNVDAGMGGATGASGGVAGSAPGGGAAGGGGDWASCVDARDCPAGARCILIDGASRCTLQSETACKLTSDCHAPLVCAPDGQCRNSCATERDCATNQFCVQNVCVSPSDLDPVGCPPLPDMPEYGCTARPRTATDCGPFGDTGTSSIGYPSECTVTLPQLDGFSGCGPQQCSCSPFTSPDGMPKSSWICPL
jgi:hypothetical protein